MGDAAQLDPSRCPLCGETNRCALEIERETGVKQPRCWCMAPDVDFSPELLSRVPPDRRGLACICARCAALAVVQD
jgi:hypothetical protein